MNAERRTGTADDPECRALLDMMAQAIRGTVTERRICVAFSGGVDSFLMARLCSDLGYGVTLVTVGFAGSHDVIFSREAGRLLGIPHHTLEIDPASFRSVSAHIRDRVRTDSLSWIENCIAFHYVAEKARSLNIPVVVTANGIDELFCGYDAYRRTFPEGPEALLSLMDAKIGNELAMMDAVGAVSAGNGVRMVQPLLSPAFVEYARGIPLGEKITGADDILRKHIVRRAALQAGVPEMSAMKRKKALQYGSRIHRYLIRSG